MLPLYLLSFFWPISFQPQEVADTLEVKRIGPQHQVGGKLPKIIFHQSRFFILQKGLSLLQWCAPFGRLDQIHCSLVELSSRWQRFISRFLIIVKLHLLDCLTSSLFEYIWDLQSDTNIQYIALHFNCIFFRMNNMNTSNPVLQYSFWIFSGWTRR